MTGDISRFDADSAYGNEASRAFFENATAQRVNTDIVIVEALRRQYPKLHLSVVPIYSCNLLSYAAAGHAAAAPVGDYNDRLAWKQYLPAQRRLANGSGDALVEKVQFGKYLVEWKGKEFVMFVANGRDGMEPYPQITNQYILSPGIDATNRLLIEAGRWTNDLHDEVWVFDGGNWQKSRELWDSVKSSNWDDVILDSDMKKSIIADVENFFNGRETYANLKVPWKRGVIYYGPPGNGKTISIKAMMHALYQRKLPVPTLYVKTLASWAGPEYSISQIFSQARRYAPCYLIFEDLDTIITPNVRSYFFNEVDGLKSNDGIFMLGSTNHLDQLDPGLSKRPSRFDRKYLFPDPNEAQRTQYAQYWQHKLKDNKDIDFPDKLCPAIASITNGFSFAYMQEAFVAALLSIAAGDHPQPSQTTNEHEERSVLPIRPATLPSSYNPYLINCVSHRLDFSNKVASIGGLILDGQSSPWFCNIYEQIVWADDDQMRTLRQHRAVERIEDLHGPEAETKYRRRMGLRPKRDSGGDRVDDLLLWTAIKKQVEILRKEM